VGGVGVGVIKSHGIDPQTQIKRRKNGFNRGFFGGRFPGQRFRGRGSEQIRRRNSNAHTKGKREWPLADFKKRGCRDGGIRNRQASLARERDGREKTHANGRGPPLPTQSESWLPDQFIGPSRTEDGEKGKRSESFLPRKNI